MTASNGNADSAAQRDAHLEDLIDEAIAESFPASDPPAVHPRRATLDAQAPFPRASVVEDAKAPVLPGADAAEPSAEAIVEQMAEALVYADSDGVIRKWNRAAAAMFGFSAAEALGQSLDMVIPERLRAAHWRGFDAAIASGATRLDGRPTLTRGQTRSGAKLYIEMSFALVRDREGRVQGSVAIARAAPERNEGRASSASSSNPASV